MPFLAAQAPSVPIGLRQRRRRAHEIGRARRDDGGRRIHDHHRLLRLGPDVGRGQRLGRERKSSNDVDLVAHDQFLGETLGHIRRGAASPRILADQLDLLAGNRIAMLLHVELDGVVHHGGDIGELTRIGHDQADLHRVLGMRRGGRDQRCGRQAGEAGRELLAFSPPSWIEPVAWRRRYLRAPESQFARATSTCDAQSHAIGGQRPPAELGRLASTVFPPQ